MATALFTCWTQNCRGSANDQLYVIHGMLDDGVATRTLCGCRIQEFGEMADKSAVGCKRCQRVLEKVVRLPVNALS